MFLHVSVILFTGGGGCAIPACIAGGIPACLAAGLQGVAGPGASAPRGVCSGGGGVCSGGSAPGGRGARPGTATTAACTHPTGMHSCSFVVSFTLAESEFCH